jgi:succinate-semialdehyde dehydrogenase/glutarate-semialdehyde dehydrogenase
MAYISINPATGKQLRSYKEHSEAQTDVALMQAKRAGKRWRAFSLSKRAQRLVALADALESQKEELARLMSEEMGKVLPEARSEIEKCAWVCRYYAEEGAGFLENEALPSDGSASYVSYQPLGCVLAIMPWNFPFWQVFRFAAPTLMAGNVALLKHAPNVSGCALAIEQLFLDAGFPEHTFQNVFLSNEAAAKVIADRRVHAVSLTGSTRAGKAVAAQAGQHLKKCVLELGGSDAYIVLDDAPLEQTVEACVTSRLINAGQSCIAAKRFIVTEGIYDEFTGAFTAAMRKKKMGMPDSDEADLGPQARHDLRDELHAQVTKSLEAGAKAALGGHVPEGDGAFYPPTVLTDVKPGMPAFDEELFGPVAAIIRAKDTEEALMLANKTTYGLGGAVFTADTAEGERIAAQELEAGCCFVNDFVRSDPRLPFGGIKSSGFGRELSRWGIREFVNAKTVYVK